MSRSFLRWGLLCLVLAWGGAPSQPLYASEESPPAKELTSSSPSTSQDEVTKKSTYQDPTQTRSNTRAPSYTWMLLRLMVVMIFIVGLLVVVVVGIRYLGYRTRLRGQEDSVIKTVSQYGVGPHKQIMVVRVVNEFYLLTVTNDNITLIDKITSKETKDSLKLEASKQGKQGASFLEILFSGGHPAFKKAASMNVLGNVSQWGTVRALQSTQKLKQRLWK